MGYYDRIFRSLVIECIIKQGSYTKPAGYLALHLLSVMKEVSNFYTNVYTHTNIHINIHINIHTHNLYIYIYMTLIGNTFKPAQNYTNAADTDGTFDNVKAEKSLIPTT